MLALSATVSLEEENQILEATGIKSPSTCIIKECPDRENIFLNKILKEGNDVLESLEQIFMPLCDSLKEQGSQFPVTLCYIPLGFMGYPSAYCRFIFDNPSIDESLYASLCSGMDDSLKSIILEDLCSESPRIRLVFCTSVIGMGFNPPSIERVIHTKPPRNLSDYVQEIGRAGRRNQPAAATLYYCKRDISEGLPDLKQDIVKFCNESKCLRDNMLKQFGFYQKSDHLQHFPHLCCIYCKSICDCFECEMAKIDL